MLAAAAVTTAGAEARGTTRSSAGDAAVPATAWVATINAARGDELSPERTTAAVAPDETGGMRPAEG